MNELKSIRRKNLLMMALVMAILFPIFAISQEDAGKLPGFINEQTILNGGKYLVNKNIKVTKNGFLIIEPGTELLFAPNTSIIVDGGLSINGKWDNPVNISSADLSNEGFGFEISSFDESKIRVKYAKFSHLIVPLKFSPNWFRPEVIIQNNSFTENRSGESGIIINRPDELLASTDILFDFSDNVFANNSCNIYIYELESNILKLNFTNNVITGNIYKGFEVGGENKSPVFSVYNANGKKYQAAFSNNAIFDNFLINDVSKTILTEINFGISGSGDKFSLANNYFGDKSKIDILATFDHFSNNNASPFLDPYPYLTRAPSNLHPFVQKLEIDKIPFDQNMVFPSTSADVRVELFLNTPIKAEQNNWFAEYYYYDNLSKQSKKFWGSGLSYQSNAANDLISFRISDSVFVKHQPGYLVIGGLQGLDNFIVPDVEPGKNHVYAEIEIKAELAKQRSQYILNMVQHKIDSLNTIPDLSKREDSVLLRLSNQLEYINELTASAVAYDSLIGAMANQLDSINIVTGTGHDIDNLTTRLEHLNSLSNQSSRQKKNIRSMHNKLDSLRSGRHYDPLKADSLIASLSLKVADLESYSLSAVFKPISKLWEAGIFVGQSFYTGDLYEGSFNSKYLYLSLGAFARYNLDSHIAASFNFNTGNIGYSAKDAGSFEARLTGFKLLAEYTFLAGQNILNPYVGIGPGLLLARQSGTSGPGSENVTTLSLPLCLGLKVKAGKNWRLSAGVNIIYPFSDSLDQLSEGGAGDLLYDVGFTASWLIR